MHTGVRLPLPGGWRNVSESTHRAWNYDLRAARLFYAQHRPEHTRRDWRSPLVRCNVTQPYITHMRNRTTRPHQRSSTAAYAGLSAYPPRLRAL